MTRGDPDYRQGQRSKGKRTTQTAKLGGIAGARAYEVSAVRL